MNLHQIGMITEYSLLGLYGIGLAGFLIFAITLLSTSIKHALFGALIAPIWPIFIAVALIRQGKASKGAPKFVETQRR